MRLVGPVIGKESPINKEDGEGSGVENRRECNLADVKAG